MIVLLLNSEKAIFLLNFIGNVAFRCRIRL